MPANKNALIRYKVIDDCLRRRYRRWTLDDLVDACCDALYEMEGLSKGVSVRTVQADIQMMRSDKLGYNAPIEVYDRKYYKYADPDYSIMNMPLTRDELSIMQETVDMLRELEGFGPFAEMSDVVQRLQDKFSILHGHRKPIIHFDSVPLLKGLKLLNPLYNYISARQTLKIRYQSFTSKRPQEYVICPYLLKEFRSRWFVFGGRVTRRTSQSVPPSLVNLALDRIVSIETSEMPYLENPGFDTEHFFDDVIGVSKNIGNVPSKIRFRASAEQTNYIKTKPLHRSQRVIEEREDGSATFEIEVVINIEMYSMFMSYGPGIEVLSPQSVRQNMCFLLRKAAGLYEGE